MTGKAVEFSHVTKTYRHPPVKAVEDCTFDVFDGEFVSIVGPSGCGKSTLLKIAAGILDISSGSVSVNGIEVKGPSLETGLVFQTPVLLKWRSTVGNVLLPAEMLHINKEEGVKRAKELLDLVGLTGFESVYPFQLSGGMQHRLALARTLMHDPKILLMDEPFSSLDALSRDQMDIEVAQICHNRKTAIFVTHNIHEAVLLSDRVVVMTDRPARVKTIINIDLPKPRTMESRRDPRMGVYAEDIRELLASSPTDHVAQEVRAPGVD